MTTPTKRPAPQFRPPTKRQPQRRSWFSSRQLLLVLGGVVLVLLVAAGIVIALGARDGDGGNGGGGSNTQAPPSTSMGGTAGGPDEVLSGPASKYLPALAEAPAGYEVDPPGTYSLSPLQFATETGLFASMQDGEAKAAQWGFADGYRASYWPIGKIAEVVQGLPIYTVDVYRFESTAGARQAWEHLVELYDRTKDSQKVDAAPLANASGAWAHANGNKISTSDVEAIYHRFGFRRGNLVVVVQTLGGKPFMNIDAARELARIADERALGEREQSTPTPQPNQFPGAAPTP